MLISAPFSFFPISSIIIVHGLQGNPWRTWLYDPSQLQRHDASPSERDLRAQRAQAGSKRRGLGSAISELARALSTTSSRRTKKVKDSVDQDGARAVAEAVYWPKDLLPADCPNARILVWGYDTVVTEGYSPVNKANLFAHAKDLLYSLERQEPKGRSIIFVAHSLGGLLVKDVLRRAQQADEAEYNDIIEFNQSCYFSGYAPSRKPRIRRSRRDRPACCQHAVENGQQQSRYPRPWPRLARARAVQRVISAAVAYIWLSCEDFSGEPRVLGSEVRDSERQGVSISVVKIFITNTNTSLPQIVPDISSSLDDPREHAETLQADHRNMTKFWGGDDPNYVKLGGELKGVIAQLSHTSPTPDITLDSASGTEEDESPDPSPCLELSKEEQGTAAATFCSG